MINYEVLWKFLRENSGFFMKMSEQYGIKADFKKEVIIRSNEWSADPFFFFVDIFRRKFVELGPSNDAEFTRISKTLYASGIRIPFGKKEYDSMINYDARNHSSINAIVSILDARTGRFTIPTRDSANKIFSNASVDLESILSGLFMYEGRDAIIYIDIFDRITGFDVILEHGSIFLPVKDSSIEKSAFNEHNLRTTNLGAQVEIRKTCGTMEETNEPIVYVSDDNTGSIKNIAKYFRTFNIQSDDIIFASNVISSISMLSSSEFSITVNGESAIHYVSKEMILEYKKNGPSSIGTLIDISRSISKLSNVYKGILYDSLNGEIPQETVEILKPYIEGNYDNMVSMIDNLIDNSDVEICSKIVTTSAESSMIRIFNKNMRYFKDFYIDRSSISSEFTPELGGYISIADECGINPDNIPSGFSGIEMYVNTLIQKSIKARFSTIPVFEKFVGAGVFMLDGIPFYNSMHSVYGTDGRQSKNGVLFSVNDTDILFPRSKPSAVSVKNSIRTLRDNLSCFMQTKKGEDEILSIMLLSTLITPMVKKANKPYIVFYGTNKYCMDGFVKKIFKDLIRGVRVENTDSESVIKNLVFDTSAPLVIKRNELNLDVIDSVATSRSGENFTFKSAKQNMFLKKANMSPVIAISKSKASIQNSVVFNFKINENSDKLSFIDDDDDVSSSILAFAINNYKKIDVIEERFISKMKKKIKKEPELFGNKYIDFFEKVLPGMVLSELCGFNDGWFYHDAAYSLYFNDSYVKSDIDVMSTILNYDINGTKVYELIFDNAIVPSDENKLFAASTASHILSSDNDERSVWAFVVFNKDVVYEKIFKGFGISRYDFEVIIASSTENTSQSNASRNYRLVNNDSVSIYDFYKKSEIGGINEFCCLKVKMKELLAKI